MGPTCHPFSFPSSSSLSLPSLSFLSPFSDLISRGRLFGLTRQQLGEIGERGDRRAAASMRAGRAAQMESAATRRGSRGGGGAGRREALRGFEMETGAEE